MKAPSPAFSFYPKDVESDETCKAMTHAEFGMYIRLLMNCWLEGSIPADPARLQRILRVSERTFLAAWPAISPCFKPGEMGRLVQSRLEIEREKQASRAKENTLNGGKGGRPRKSNDYAKNGKRTVSAEEPNVKPNESETKGRAPVSSPSPSPTAISTQPPSSPSVDSRSDADAARSDLRKDIQGLRVRQHAFSEKTDQGVLDCAVFHSTSGGVVRIDTCSSAGLMRATSEKVRAYGQAKRRKVTAPGWDRGADHAVSDEEIEAWDPRLGPRPTEPSETRREVSAA